MLINTQERLGDTKGAINRRGDITMVKRKRENGTNNNLHNTTENKRSRNKNRVNSGARDELPYIVPLVGGIRTG